MKKLKFALLLSLFANWTFAQLVNDGATITIKNGATLFVESDVQNNTTGTITVETGGTLEVQGSFTNAATALIDVQGTGKLKFTGANNSNLTTNTDPIRNLEVSKSNSTVTLVDNLTISNNLDFASAGSSKLVLGANTAILNSATTITGNDTDEYVNASGAGFLQKNYADGALAASPYTFPVGDATNYSPLTTAVTGTAFSANLKVNVVNAVHPNKPAAAESFLTRYWNVDQTGITSYLNSLTGTYVSGDDSNGTPALIKGASYDGTNWSYAGAATNGTSTVSGTTSAALSDFTGTNFYGKVNARFFLQGAYNPATGLMTTNLNARNVNNILQNNALTSPYTDTPPASVASNFFYDAGNPTVNQNIVDWVKLEFRDPASPNTPTTFKASAFLKNDGTIVGIDGTSLPEIENGWPTSVVVVSHRNHLSVRTLDAGINTIDLASPYNLTGNVLADTTVAYRRTTGANTNSNLVLVSGANPKLCLWGGNGNGNSAVNYGAVGSDRTALLTNANTPGLLTRGLGNIQTTIISNVYGNNDLNLNGTINYGAVNTDRTFLVSTVLGNIQTRTINQHL